MNLKDKVMFIGIGYYGGEQVKELDALVLSDEKEEVKPVRKASKFDVLKKRMNR